jgi:hypothetical protein
MNPHHEILRYLPAQATAAGFIPVILLAFNKLAMRQTVHKQRDLREKVIALNVFIGNMHEFPDGSEHHATCQQDAVRQRGLLLMQLASRPPAKAGRLTRLCQAALRVDFSFCMRRLVRSRGRCTRPSFLFLIAALTGLIRALFHIAYLRPTILVPIVIGDFLVVILVRLASFYVDQPKPGEPAPAASTV